MTRMNLPMVSWSHDLHCSTMMLTTCSVKTAFVVSLLNKCLNVSRRHLITSFVNEVGILLNSVTHADARAWQKTCDPHRSSHVSLLRPYVRSAATTFAASNCVAPSSCPSFKIRSAQERHAQWVPVSSNTLGSVQLMCVSSSGIVFVVFEITLIMKKLCGHSTLKHGGKKGCGGKWTKRTPQVADGKKEKPVNKNPGVHSCLNSMTCV